MDRFEYLQGLWAQREEIRKLMKEAKRDIIESADQAERFFIMAEMEDLYKADRNLTGLIDRWIEM